MVPLNNNKDTVRSEYGAIVDSSEIPISIDKICDVWNESDIETVPEKSTVISQHFTY